MGHLQLVETGCKPCVPQEDGHPFLELQALCFFQPLHPSMLLHAFPRAWSMGRSKSKTRKKGKEDERKKACVSCRIPCSLSNTKKEIKWRTGRSGLMKRVILQNLNQEDNVENVFLIIDLSPSHTHTHKKSTQDTQRQSQSHSV